MKFKSDIEVQAGLKDSGDSSGTAGQILSSTLNGVSWINPDTLTSDSSEYTHVLVKNTSGAVISKGTPVYVTGEIGNSGKISIAIADASDSTKMPALGILGTALNDNGEGYCITGGLLEALVTDVIDGVTTTANDTVYVKSGGGLTMTKPTGTNLIQNIAKVARTHLSNGSLFVSSIIRTNDVPNLPTGRLFVGTDNNTSLASDVIFVDDANSEVVITGDVSATNLSGTNTGDQDLSSFITTSTADGKYLLNTTDTLTGTLTATNALSVTSVDAGNPQSAQGESRLSGYGLMMNRSVSYITNASATGEIKFGIGGAHNSGTKLTLSTSGGTFAGTVGASNLSGTNTGDQDLRLSDTFDYFEDNSAVSLHQFNNSLIDAGGNYNATSNGASFGTVLDTKFGTHGINTQGDGTYIDIAGLPTIQAVSLWYKAIGNDNGYIVDFRHDTPGNGRSYLYTLAGSDQYINMGDDTTASNQTGDIWINGVAFTSGQYNFTSGNWYHIVITTNTVSTKQNWNQGIRIGNRSDGTSNGNAGYFDQVRTFNRRLTSADVSALYAEVETGATADQTAEEILSLIKTVDGATSGLDADLLDGNQASAFAPSSVVNQTDFVSAASGGTFSGNIDASNLSGTNTGDNSANTNNSLFIDRGALDLTSATGGDNGLPFDNAHTETKIAENGMRTLTYTGASAFMYTFANGGSASVVQYGAHYNGNDFYMRTRTDSSAWNDWRKLYHDNNIPTWNQNTTGNAATVTTNANLTGHITSVGNAAVLGSFTTAQLNAAISDGSINIDQTLPTDFVSAASGGTFSGNIDASNLSGTNTGDQDLSSYSLTSGTPLFTFDSTADLTSPSASTGTWTNATATDWGTPKIGTSLATFNDGTGTLSFTVPTGMKTAYISQLTWSSGGYIDVYGVQSDGGEVFLRRINTKQTIENSNEGDPNQHDGTTIAFAGHIGDFPTIMLHNKVGRIHLTGLGFSKSELAASDGTGIVNYGQLTGTVPTWNQNTNGNAATVTTNADLTGHITSVGNAAVLGSFTTAQLNAAISDGSINIDQTDITGNAGTAGKLFAGGTGPGTEDLNTIADSVSTGQLEYRGYNSSSTNKPTASDNANGVITVGQHSGNYNAQLAFSSDGNMYWRDNPGIGYGSWEKLWTDTNLTNVSQLTNDAGYITSYIDTNTTYDNTDFVDLTSNQTVGGIKTFTSDMVIKNGDPTLGFADTDASNDDFYIHVNSNNFYVLVDRDDTGLNEGITGWDGAHPLQLEGDTNKAYTFGNEIYHTGNIPTWNQNTSGNAATATWADTVDVNGSHTGSGEYNVMWNSGDTVYSTNGITINRDSKRITTPVIKSGTTSEGCEMKYNSTSKTLDFVFG